MLNPKNNNYESEKKAAASAKAGAAASSANCTLNFIRMFCRQHVRPLFATLQGMGVIPTGWGFRFSIFNMETGKDLFTIKSLKTETILSPRGMAYEMPTEMVKGLRLAETPHQVAVMMFNYCDEPCIQDCCRSIDFRELCIHLTGKDLNQITVRNTFNNLISRGVR